SGHQSACDPNPDGDGPEPSRAPALEHRLDEARRSRSVCRASGQQERNQRVGRLEGLEALSAALEMLQSPGVLVIAQEPLAGPVTLQRRPPAGRALRQEHAAHAVEPPALRPRSCPSTSPPTPPSGLPSSGARAAPDAGPA